LQEKELSLNIFTLYMAKIIGNMLFRPSCATATNNIPLYFLIQESSINFDHRLAKFETINAWFERPKYSLEDDVVRVQLVFLHKQVWS